MPTLYYTDYSNPSVTQQRVIASFLNLNLTLQHISKHAPLILVDDSLVLNQPHAISMHLLNQSKILGHQFQDQIEVYSWLQYYNVEIHPLVTEIYGQIFGKITINQQKYNYAFEQLKRTLKVLDDRLKLKTYLVGESLTLVDIVLCCQLQTAFRLLVTPDLRKKLINLIRWYTYVRNQKPFVDCSGKMYLCENPFKLQVGHHPENIGGAKKEQVQQKNSQPKQQKKKNQKKQEIKKLQKQQKPTKKQQDKTEEGKVQQKQGQFNLDDFKRAFQNTEDKITVIDQMLNNLSQGWSIWKVYYSKDVTQGKIDYLTSNLAKGTLQRLQNLRKTGFGNWGVYYSQQLQQYEIRGVMLWKGQDIAPAWKQHPSYEYHLFHKLDPKSPEDQKLVKDYWLQAEMVQGLKYYNSFKLI